MSTTTTTTATPYRVLLNADADRETWLRARREGLGGSDAAAVLGWGGYSSPLEVYASKISTEVYEDDDSESMLWGRLLEDVIAREWARRECRKIEQGPALVQSIRWPWMLASVDRLVIDPTTGKPCAPLECKNRSSFTSDDWDEEIPADVVAQVLHYCAVYGLDVGYVACLIGGNQLRTFTVNATPDIVEDLAEAEREWWESHVEARVLPPLTPAGSDSAALARLYPNPAGNLELGPDAIDLLRRRHKINAVYKDAKAERDAVDDEIRLTLAEHVEGHIGGKKFVQWKPGFGQRSTDLDRLAREFPDAYAACVAAGQPTRRLTYSKKEIPS